MATSISVSYRAATVRERPKSILRCIVLGGLALSAVMFAQKASTSTSGPTFSYSATTANVGGAPDSIRIDLFRWSTDAERDQFVSAWSMTGAFARSARAGGRGGAGRGAAGRGGRGADPAPDPEAVGGAAARAGRGGRAADPAPDPDALETPAPRRGGEDGPATPESTLAKALKQAPTVGYLWSSEIAGYAIRYAVKVAASDGAERILLITDRPLGATNDLWKPVGGAAPSAYDFSVIELHVNSKGEGEGKISLTGKVASDSALKVVAPENYTALPVVLKNVKHRAVDGQPAESK